jgi:hypothetical protein
MSRKTNWLGAAFTLVVSAYLIYRLTRLGWSRVWSSIPTAPLFYLALVARFLVLPVSQALAFKRIWGLPFRRVLPASLIKRTLDKNVIDLSGDVYFYAWSKRNIAASSRDILLALKDNLLMSSAASAAGSVILLSIFLGAGVIVFSPGRLFSEGWHAILLAAAGAAAGYVVFRFRRKILFLPRKTLVTVFLLHFGRGLIVMALQVVQWAAAMPGVLLAKWLNLLAAQIVIGFIPIMPSRNLVFFGAGLELSDRLALDAPELAGMFLAANVVVQGLNLALFLWASFAVKRGDGPGRTGGRTRAVNGNDGTLRGSAASAGPPTETAGPGREGPSS